MRARRLPALLAVALVTTFATPLAAQAAAPDPAPAAPRSEDPRTAHRSTGRLQVRFKDGVDARGREAALARVRAKGRSAVAVERLASLNAALLDVDDPRAVQALLREDPAVLYAEAESTYKAFAADTQTAERTAAALPDAATRDAATFPTGTGTEIAVIDSVVDSGNPDLTGKVTVSQDLTELVGDTDPTDGWDVTDMTCDAEHCPHGTGVAAVAAAADGNGDVVGAAPGASIASYNVFRRFLYTDEVTADQFEDLSASSMDIAEALDAVRQRALTHPELVAVNMSLGGAFDSQLVRDAIADLRADAPHVTVVVAAGNDGGERANFPAGDPGVISVGSSGVPGDPSTCNFSGATTVSSFSNRGDVDLVAPGACVLTWYRPDSIFVPGQHSGSRVKMRVDGTSFSAPMVAGVVALLGEEGVKGDAARAAILAGATQPATPNVATGVGTLNAANAVAVATGASPYTAAFIARGGQVANQVGRRAVEVIQVQPGETPTAPTTVAPVLTSGRGTLTAGTSTVTGGVRNTAYTYATPAANVGLVSFTMTAGSLVVPMRLLDPTDSFEGLAMASGDVGTAALAYGSRSAYVRSAVLAGGGSLKVDYTYGDAGTEYGDPDVPPSSDLFFWEPLTAGGDADAATEPFEAAQGSTYTGAKTVPAAKSGKHLYGWLLFSSEDDSDATSRYIVKPTYTGPNVSLNAPAVASSVSTNGPFRVSWTGSNVVKYEVEWTTRVKASNGTWNFGTWKLWTSTTAPAGYDFGRNNKPVAIVKGQTYWFRIRAFDSKGNPSVYVTKATVVPQDNLSTSFSYAGSWAKQSATGHWFTWLHKSAASNASVSHRAETSQFTVIGDRCGTCGQFRVYVDGVLKATVDTRSTTGTKARQVLWTSASLGAPKAHAIKIVVLRTSGRPWVVIDGIGTLR